MSRFTELVPIRTQEEFAIVQKAATEDNHLPLWASHYMRRGVDGITGFAGLEDYYPFVHLWSHTKKMAAMDSFSMLNGMENYLRCKGKRGIIIPAYAGSTFIGHLARAGYTQMFDTTIHYKAL